MALNDTLPLLPRRLAERLVADALTTPDLLPSTIRRLAARYGASYVTMWKAVSTCVREGHLSSRRGLGVFLDDKRPGQGSMPGHAQKGITDLLRTHILDGTYYIGATLPKLSYLAAQHARSLSTITNAIHDLAREKLVHKKGRQWIAGPPKPAAAVRPRMGGATVVVLVRTIDDWHSLTTFFHPMRFISTFTEELSKNGLIPIVTSMEPIENVSHPFPQGFEGVKSLVEELGHSFAGALIIDPAPSVSELSPWIHLLSQDGAQPVVFFDSTSQGEGCTRDALGAKRGYYRAFLDEYEAVRTALDFVAGLGHRRIGVPMYGGGAFAHWAPRRLELIRQYASRSSGTMTVYASGQTEPFWNFGYEFGTDVFIERNIRKYVLTGSGRMPTSSYPRRLLKATPSMRSLLDRDVTALVAMNDRAAQEVYRWCTAAALRVPEQLSMISFDNEYQSLIMPISSVDFGFAQLGYLSAHAIVKDFAVRPDAQGNLPATCRVVDRGSVRTVIAA